MIDENTLQLTSKVNITECETFPQALSTATEEAGNTGGHAYPVVMFRQGKRISFSGALPMKRVESFLDLQKSARKGDSMDKLRAATNRPHIPEHTAAIANYIKENPRGLHHPGTDHQRSGAHQRIHRKRKFHDQGGLYGRSGHGASVSHGWPAPRARNP